MHLNRSLHTYKLVFADFLAAFLAWIIFYLSRSYVLQDAAEGSTWFLLERSFIIGSIWVVLYALLGRYRNVFRQSRFKEVIHLATFSFCGGVAIFIAFLLEDPAISRGEVYYKTIATYFLIHFFVAATFKLIALKHLKVLVAEGEIYFNTLVVGSSTNAREVYNELQYHNWHLGLKVVGFVQSDASNGHAFPEQVTCLGGFHELPDLIQKYDIEEVVIAIEPSEHKLIEQILSSLEGEMVRISILPDVYQILLGSVKVNHLFGTPLIEVKQEIMPVWQQILKRVIDLGVSLVVLICFLPVYAIVALLVKLSSPGPVFFAQERIGWHGKPFKIYKFRSMFLDAEKMGPALSSDLDPRVTKFGRFMRKIRLDELPQFYNVLKGDMSLVGPRPERQFFIDLITKEAPHYRHLQRVRPGITSLGQVKFGYAQNVQEMVRRLKYDILYIENMSLAMDFRVMLYTIKIIVQGRGK
ncbi:exopolysaccharide biosynthesis polyprenyl glycosylphosphotransferase [Nibribacter ruber]|uniref:Exopolysaccharide biosynthesis polyprenyl glycosylphosphotransferase n=1 Tax=Nibribacter ruber TaxID=2698458 RepID=A0A6P1NRE6_9BACT|nr:sugar transferase [Nibribacter ruber]QHL86406.1 exopolysaccharide biosynthesis polyprenyl glycosylphosphotransferase [Nibribacter ruber]